MKKISNCKSFTLVEVLIVIGIIAILILISMPIWRNIQPSIELSGTVRELITDLRYAQQLAVAEQVIYAIRFDFEENKYQIIKYKEANGTTEETIKIKFLPGGIILEQVNNFSEAKFTPYGSVLRGGNVRLTNAQNQAKTIDIRPSGFVRITN